VNDDLIDDVIDTGADDTGERDSDGADGMTDAGGGEAAGKADDSAGGAAGKAEDGEGGTETAGKDGDTSDGDGNDDSDDEKPTKVPLSELLEERRRRQAMEQQAMELQARIAAQEQLKEEMRQLREQLKGEDKDDDSIPDFEEDPIEHLKAKTEKQEQVIQQQLEAQRQAQEQQQAMLQQEQAVRQVVTEISKREAEFTKEAPDYYDALEYVRGIQRQNLSGLGLSPDQIEAEVTRAELETGVAALQNGVDPASYVYNIAKRMGYNGKGRDNDGHDGDAGGGTDSNTKAKMDALEKGTKAQSTDGGGASLKELAEIDDDDEFEAAMREVFGG